MATPFSLFSFFLGHASLACHLFSFWGNPNLTLFYFRDVLQESLPRHGSFIDGKLMDLVRVYDRESMKSISLGSHNLTKLDRTSSSICVRFFSWNMTYGSGTTLHITGELAFLDFWKQLQISSVTRTNLYNFTHHIYAHNNLDLNQAYATHGTFRFIDKIFA